MIFNTNDIEFGFKVISAPASTTLTQSELADIIQGCVINESFATYSRCVFMPAVYTAVLHSYNGIVICHDSGSSDYINYYTINASNVLTITSLIQIADNKVYAIKNLNSVNNKTIPNYPVDLTKDYFLKQSATSGNLQWSDESYAFKVIDPPASTTLNDDQIELFKNGVAIRGNFLGMSNPIFMPCARYDDTRSFLGIAIGEYTPLTPYGGAQIWNYIIDKTTKVIRIGVNKVFPMLYFCSGTVRLTDAGSVGVEIWGLKSINRGVGVTPERSIQIPQMSEWSANRTMATSAIEGTTAPTTSTFADYVGCEYINTTTGDMYKCTAITPQGTTTETYSYTWRQISFV